MDSNTMCTTLNTASNLLLSASNSIVEYAVSNVQLTGAFGNMNLWAGKAISLVAQSNSFSVSATSGSNYLIMDSNTMCTTLNTASNWLLSASNSINEYAISNVQLTGAFGNMNLWAGKAISLVAQSNSFSVSATSGSNYMIMDSNTMCTTLNTASNLLLSASNSINEYAVSNIQMTGAFGNMNLWAGKAISLVAQSNSFSVSATSGSNYLIMDSNTMCTTLNTASNLLLSASNSIVEYAVSNVQMTGAFGNMNLWAGKAISLVAQSNSFSVTATSGSNYMIMDSNTMCTTLNTASNLLLSASNSIVEYAVSNVQLTGAFGNMNLWAGKAISLVAQSNSFSVTATSGSNYMLMDSNTSCTYMNTASNLFRNASNSFVDYAVSNVQTVAGQMISLVAQSNSLSLSGGKKGTGYLLMDQSTSSTTLSSYCNISFNASNNYTIIGSNLFTANILSNISATSVNGSVTATANQSVSLTAQNNSLTLSGGQGTGLFVQDLVSQSTTMNASKSINIGASNTLTGAAGLNLLLSAGTGYATIQSAQAMTLLSSNDSVSVSATNGSNTMLMDKTTNCTYLNSASNISMGASNSILKSANSNIYMTAIKGATSITTGTYMTLVAQSNSLTLSATQGSNYFALDSATNCGFWNSTSNINVSASNSLQTIANSNMSFIASTGTATLTSGQAMNLTSQHNTFSVSATNGSNYFTMDSNTSCAFWQSLSNVNIGASNSILGTSVSNIQLIAGQNTTITSTKSIVSTANNGNNMLILDAASGNSTLAAGNGGSTFIYSSNSITEKASIDMTLTAQSGAVTINAGSGGGYIKMDTAKTITVAAATNMVIGASNMVSICALNNDIVMSAHNSNMYMTMSHTTDSVTRYALGSVTENCGSTMYVGAQSDATFTTHTNMTVSASNSTTLSAYNGGTTMVMSGQNGTIATNATGYTMNVSGLPLLNFTPNTVQILGNLQVQGVIDSINVQQQNLLVENKEIYLAYSSNASPVIDGPANDQSGIIIQGAGVNPLNQNPVPQYTTASNQNVYEKSVKWNYGVGGIFTSNASTESFWEVKGGALKLTNQFPTAYDTQNNVTASNPISYTFRINSTGELEIVKFYNKNNAVSTSVVAKFGRMLASII